MVAIPEEVLPWFDAPEFAVIATILPSGRPHQAVVWVTRDGNDVLVSTVKGRRKHLNVEADPRCSVIVYPKDNPTPMLKFEAQPKSKTRELAS